jgi:hypothetical protein
MADRLATFPAGPAKNRVSRYPWHQWMDGSIWRIVQGRDYIVKRDFMRKLLYVRASRKGVHVRVTQADPLTLIFQFYEGEQPPEMFASGVVQITALAQVQ